jgi:hypothetical protein
VFFEGSGRARVFARSLVGLLVLAGCGGTRKVLPRGGHDDALGAGGTAGTSGAGTGGGSSAGRAGSTATGGTGGDVTVEHDAGEGGGCERAVTLQGVVLSEPEPFDLVIVADNSQSVAWSRDELSAGLSDLLANVQGRSVRIFLLTPTQYGASSAAAREPLSGDYVVEWQDPATESAYSNAMTDYTQTCTDENGAAIDCPDPTGMTAYKANGVWSFVMPQAIATLTPDLSDADFMAEQATVADAILAIGGTGSPHEQPLCTLSRYVRQAPALLPKNAVFLVISDEDDESVPEDCLASFSSELTQFDGGDSVECASNCDEYEYIVQGTASWLRDAFTCAAFTDTGDLIPGTDASSFYNYGVQASCDDVTPAPCTDAERVVVQSACPSGLTLTTCDTGCVTNPVDCGVTMPDQSVDVCTEPFSYEGQMWTSLAAFCANQGSDFSNCQVLGRNLLPGEAWEGTDSPDPLMTGLTTADIGRDFTAQVAAAFGAGKYLVEGILYDSSFGCTLGPGQSYASNIEAVIGDPTHVFSLCAPYAPALASVLDFAQTLLQTQYPLTLASDEHVTAVIVIAKDGTERTLAATDYDFDAASGTLEIHQGVLRGTDANLRVEVTSDCRPNVR